MRWSSREPTIRAALVTSVLLAALAGCADDPVEPAASVDAAESRVVRGPVEMVVRADRETVTVGEKLTLEVLVAAAEGVTIEMPSPDKALGVFAVRGEQAPPDVPDGDVRRWTHTWVLDTFTPGETEIPALECSFVDKRPDKAGPDGAPIEGTLRSEPLAIVVRSVLQGDETEADHRDIKPALATDEFEIVQAEQTRRRWIAAAYVAGGVLLLAALALLVRWRLLRPKPAPPPVPAHEWALGQLDALASAGLVEAHRYEAYFVRLSGIVREYIERRFAIMAPERTTDEFLAEAQRSTVLDEGHRDLLKTFLRAADMVKFALYRPSETESSEALAAARRFVLETRPAPAVDDAGSPRERAPEEVAA